MLIASPVAASASERPLAPAKARLALLAMAAYCLASWLLLHPFGGIVHDSTLYTFLALAHLHPEALSSDVFVRFGSQDQYTIFSPIYARAIVLLGLEPAAELLTFLSHLAFFCCAWFVARRFMSALAATLAVTLLVIVPGEYGSDIYFHFTEAFVTPRLPAEALVLAAIIATLAKRHWIALICIILSVGLHPVMAVAGVAFLLLTFVAPLRPKLFVGACAAAIAASFIVLAVAPITRLDPEWFRIVRVTSPYLYLDTWSPSDWVRLGTLVAVLTIGLLTNTTPLVRKFCAGTLATIGCGMFITAVYCDLLHVVIFTALQSWRWLWLATVLAVLLLPVVARDCWQSGSTGRAALVFLASAWVLHTDSLAPYLLPMSIGCALIPPSWRDHRYARLASAGAWGILIIAVAMNLSARLQYLPTDDTGAPSIAQKMRVACGDGVIPAVLAILMWWSLRASESATRLSVLLAATALIACATLAPFAWSSWTQAHYTEALHRKFSAWRAEIPQGAEIMWPDSPVGAWYLLERPIYWSPHQIAGAIFSRDKAVLLARRTRLLNDVLIRRGILERKPDVDLLPVDTTKIDTAALTLFCTDHDLRYVASWLRLGVPAAAPVLVDPSRPSSTMYLYRCADFGT